MPRPVLAPGGDDGALTPAELPVNQVVSHHGDSENDDLRSIIDDLTIENQRLRQQLANHRSRPGSQLSRGGLFEVKTRGLPIEKKRELELLLQKFALSVPEDSRSSGWIAPSSVIRPNSSTAVGEGTTSYLGASDPPQDSAYASMTNSGMSSTTQTQVGAADTQKKTGARTRRMNPASYWRDFPENLRPGRTPSMSEQTQMKLVVQRLEQLFTGRSAAGKHSQPMQQQKVSESAAEADRRISRQLNRQLRPEGAREASILPFGSHVDLEPLPGVTWSNDASRGQANPDEPAVRSSSGNQSPKQRPTRPMDLDIHRAQVVEDNISYIRHLGLPTPHCKSVIDHQEGDGWVYLNLLTNMAQLHTANVTPAFIKKAIATLSTKFELSKDGHKLRWKGGSVATTLPDRLNSDRDSTYYGHSRNLSRETSCPEGSEEVASAAPQAFRDSSRALDAKAGKTFARGRPPPGTKRQTRHGHGDPCAFKPGCIEWSNRAPIGFSVGPGQPTPVSSANFELTERQPEAKTSTLEADNGGQQRGDGFLVYYRGLPFYMDVTPENDLPARQIATISPTSTQILGSGVGSDFDQSRDVGDHPAVSGGVPVENVTAQEDLPLLSLHPLADNIENESDMITLDASGVGGVLPEDHFQLRVRRRRSRLAQLALGRPPPHQRLGHSGSIEENLLSITREDLQPSELPPPSFFLHTSSTQSSFPTESDEALTVDQQDSAERLASSFTEPCLDSMSDQWPSQPQNGVSSPSTHSTQGGSSALRAFEDDDDDGDNDDDDDDAAAPAGAGQRTSDAHRRHVNDGDGKEDRSVCAAKSPSVSHGSLRAAVGTDSVGSMLGSTASES